MQLNYTEIWTWNKKILYDVEVFHYCKIEIENIGSENNYHFYFLNRNQLIPLFKHNILNNISYKTLVQTYQKSKDLQDYYEEILLLCKKENITHIIFTGTGQYWHPDFLKKLKENWIIISLSTADDDTNKIKKYSLPYTKYYDFHFHVWVMYNRDWTTIAEKLREWWWNPVWIPLGARADHINEKVDFENRDIEVCYIWNINPCKLFRLAKLKRYFGDRFKLYGLQGNGDWKSLKWIFYKVMNKLFGLWYIEPVSDEKHKEIYGRTKIGFNMHLVSWKWPSNSRLYELPCNWVMQVCDNELGLKMVFEIWKEIVAYKNIHDAIKKIEYYLKNDKERIKIAKAWYKRAMANYLYQDVFITMFDIIFGLK